MKRLSLAGREAEHKPASDIFVVNGTSGNDPGIARLIDLMGEHGSFFYKSVVAGKSKGRRGLIAPDDTLIIKVNSQWDERGGTNTDLVKSLINAIICHPDGFIGEIVIADNGQAQYGSTRKGGRLDYTRNNAQDLSQSIQKVADSFAGHKVSTYLWDNITETRVKEYDEGDNGDGYVVTGTANPSTNLMVSYPKFTTKFGTRASLKFGIWNDQTRTYDTNRLKLINVPVLKAHFIYGVTASVKHYMGVVSDKLTAQLGARSHVAVKTGGMGTEMTGTRFPVLNILDAIWVNATPGKGPGTPYDDATQANVIAASIDPVALDYWASKNILMQAARENGHTDLSFIDPDNRASGSFGDWLRRAMEEIRPAGYQATDEESHMNVYVAEL